MVYSAKDHLLSRTVAVKILRSQFADDMSLSSVSAEKKIASLSHPNIVIIIGESWTTFIIL